MDTRSLLRMVCVAICLGTATARAVELPQIAPPASPNTGKLEGTVSIADSSGGAVDLSRAVVYLGSSPELDRMGPGDVHPVMPQRNKAFVRDLLVVTRGSTVEFPNEDPYSHNVFSRSRAAQFDLDRYPAGQSKSYTFNTPGIVQLFCNIHPNMKATIYVVPNRFFARADRSGKFQLSGVPSGSYELFAWHDRCDERHVAVHVEPSRAEPVTIALQANGRRVAAPVETVPPSRRPTPGVERGLGVKRERLNLPVIQGAHPTPNR